MADTDTGKILVIIGILIFMVPFFVIPLAMASGTVFSLSPAIFVCSALGMVLMIIGSALSGASRIFGSGSHRQRIPPVEYPREATTRKQADDVTILDCPNCGAPPRYVDANGLCMCEFCDTKYKVR